MPQTLLDLEQSDYLGGSGTFVSDEELGAASGFIVRSVEQSVHIIPARGEETDSKPRTLFDIPVNEYVKGSDTATWWSVRVPFGVQASGITLATAWFIEASGAGQDIDFEIAVKPLVAGEDLSAVAAVSHTETLSAEVGAYVGQVSEITIPISPARSFFSFKFTRKASTDTYTGSVFTVAHGVRFEVA